MPRLGLSGALFPSGQLQWNTSQSSWKTHPPRRSRAWTELLSARPQARLSGGSTPEAALAFQPPHPARWPPGIFCHERKKWGHLRHDGGTCMVFSSFASWSIWRKSWISLSRSCKWRHFESMNFHELSWFFPMEIRQFETKGWRFRGLIAGLERHWRQLATVLKAQVTWSRQRFGCRKSGIAYNYLNQAYNYSIQIRDKVKVLKEKETNDQGRISKYLRNLGLFRHQEHSGILLQ